MAHRKLDVPNRRFRENPTANYFSFMVFFLFLFYQKKIKTHKYRADARMVIGIFCKKIDMFVRVGSIPTQLIKYFWHLRCRMPNFPWAVGPQGKLGKYLGFINPAWGYGVTPHPQAGIASSQMRLFILRENKIFRTCLFFL